MRNFSNTPVSFLPIMALVVGLVGNVATIPTADAKGGGNGHGSGAHGAPATSNAGGAVTGAARAAAVHASNGMPANSNAGGAVTGATRAATNRAGVIRSATMPVRSALTPAEIEALLGGTVAADVAAQLAAIAARHNGEIDIAALVAAQLAVNRASQQAEAVAAILAAINAAAASSVARH